VRRDQTDSTAREVDRGATSRGGRAPLSDLTTAGTHCPQWRTFPACSRVAVVRTLGVLIERMTSPTSQDGGEGGGCRDDAEAVVGEQGDLAAP